MAHMVYIIHDIWYICYISSDDNDANIIQKLVKLLIYPFRFSLTNFKSLFNMPLRRV